MSIAGLIILAAMNLAGMHSQCEASETTTKAMCSFDEMSAKMRCSSRPFYITFPESNFNSTALVTFTSVADKGERFEGVIMSVDILYIATRWQHFRSAIVHGGKKLVPQSERSEVRDCFGDDQCSYSESMRFMFSRHNDRLTNSTDGNGRWEALLAHISQTKSYEIGLNTDRGRLDTRLCPEMFEFEKLLIANER